MANLNEVIQTAQGFKYSINLKYDINDLTKINNYIPTDKSLQIIDEVLTGFEVKEANRSHILLGSYGTGKSHLTMVLASLLADELSLDDYTDFLNQFNNYDQQLAAKIEQFITDKYLIVLPEEGLSNFEQSIILGLKKALQEQGLEDYLPNTFYDLIIDKINHWQEEFTATYQDLGEILKEEYEIGIKDFIRGIKNYNRDYYHIFLDIHPRLTAGSKFTPYNRVRITELLTEVEEDLSKLDYQGVFFLFDEFGKYLEENIASFNIKDIQDLAEYCNREDNQLNSSLLLITHKNLAQYTSTQQESIEEWRKVAGRFKRHNITKHS
ncbi:MAG: hypothetical protein ACQEQI_06565, partial [Bacillota bacterium]